MRVRQRGACMDLLTPARKWAAEQISADGHPHDHAHAHAHGDAHAPLPFPQQLALFLSIFLPILILIVTIVRGWRQVPAMVGWPQRSARRVMYCVAGFGTT